jgi:gliding motility associated protien GldN
MRYKKEFWLSFSLALLVSGIANANEPKGAQGVVGPTGTQTTTTNAPPPQQSSGAPNSSVYGPTVNNGVYTPEHLPNRKPIPYTPLREADVIWSKRIWRAIDLREKINHPLYFPTGDVSKRPPLFNIIQKGLISGELTAYDPNPAVFDPDEEFKVEYTAAQAQKALFRETSVLKLDSVTQEMVPVTIPDTIKADRIAQYWLKEDWFFDKQRSVMDVRILGIAPVVENIDDKGEFKGHKALFWLYYPACRNYFAKFQSYNPYNDAEWRTFDEIFQKRMFSSYIKEESNVYNRPILETGVDYLLKSDEIKDQIFKLEHDMWHF